MSELKVYHHELRPGEYDEFYLKSEADKVIAELKNENERLKKLSSCAFSDDCLRVRQLKQKLQDQCTSCPVKMQEDDVVAEKDNEIRRLKRALWLARAEHYKMREFIAREEANLSDQIAWSQFLRERTYNQWVGQLLRIANLANKLHNKCLAKAEEYYK